MANRLLTINIRDYLVSKPRTKRHKRIAKYVRERVAHYTKIEEQNVKISKDLNTLMIKRYAASMLPLKLNVSIENGMAQVSAFGAKPEAPAGGAAKAGDKGKKKADGAAPAAAPAKAAATTAKEAKQQPAAKKNDAQPQKQPVG